MKGAQSCSGCFLLCTSRVSSPSLIQLIFDASRMIYLIATRSHYTMTFCMLRSNGISELLSLIDTTRLFRSYQTFPPSLWILYFPLGPGWWLSSHLCFYNH